jgi:hypothetical protein
VQVNGRVGVKLTLEEARVAAAKAGGLDTTGAEGLQ